jgi:hypothetical protein
MILLLSSFGEFTLQDTPRIKRTNRMRKSTLDHDGLGKSLVTTGSVHLPAPNSPPTGNPRVSTPP